MIGGGTLVKTLTEHSISDKGPTSGLWVKNHFGIIGPIKIQVYSLNLDLLQCTIQWRKDMERGKKHGMVGHPVYNSQFPESASVFCYVA